MKTDLWRCPECKEKLEAGFTECWKCGYVRGSGGDEKLEEGWQASDPMQCPTCRVQLDFLGTKKFHEGPRAGAFFFGHFGELFVNRGHFDVFICSRCGRVEFFLDGVGEEFRDH